MLDMFSEMNILTPTSQPDTYPTHMNRKTAEQPGVPDQWQRLSAVGSSPQIQIRYLGKIEPLGNFSDFPVD